jgi:hypothetical protein
MIKKEIKEQIENIIKIIDRKIYKGINKENKIYILELKELLNTMIKELDENKIDEKDIEKIKIYINILESSILNM